MFSSNTFKILEICFLPNSAITNKNCNLLDQWILIKEGKQIKYNKNNEKITKKLRKNYEKNSKK